MASLDVESLFTNIALDETIENSINDLFSNNDTVDNFIKKDPEELKIASYEWFFTFDNEYFCQLGGVTPWDPRFLASPFLCHFEKQCFLIARKVFVLTFIEGMS